MIMKKTDGGGKEMKTRVIIDGNAFYEVDEECIRRKEAQEQKRENRKPGQKNGNGQEIKKQKPEKRDA
ncbi:MAG: hypothetical protein PHE06_04050 [Lachnospiraceae bacterium]|nr:hypothetical protein [Lachnospiraceae bacterium]MDD3795137.1 hypothetical protein [Lachnospiraceae bacterium]